MSIALLLAAALAWWLHKKGELVPNLLRLVGTGVGALIAIKLLEGGRILPAVIVGAAAWGWWTFNRPVDSLARARTLLGVGDEADAVIIQAAWRARIAAAHPDAGGSVAAAQAVTEARDLLLSALPRT